MRVRVKVRKGRRLRISINKRNENKSKIEKGNEIENYNNNI